jgi:preprotein translocase subunit YajC
MEYQNIFIFILIFIVLMTMFYFIINNLGISNNQNTNINNSQNINELEKNILILKYELSNIKNKIKPVNNEYNKIKEIIIETDNASNIDDKNNINYILPNINQNNQTSKPPPIIYDPIANYDIAKLSDPLVDPRGRTSADQIPTPQVAAQFNFPTQGVLDRYHRVGLLIAIGRNNNENKLNKFGLPYNNSNESESESEFIWKGHSKTKKNKKQYTNTESIISNIKSYKGIEIKENFDSDSDYDSDDDYNSIEEFGNTDKKIVNVYNNYSNQNDNNILELIGKKITDNWYKYFTSITVGNKIIKVVIRNKNRKELYSGDIVYIPEIGKSFRVKIDPMDMIEYNPYMF